MTNMKTLETKNIDKTGWSEGPWMTEPDKKQWQDPETGLPCLIVRGPSGGLCGYVGVSEGHPAYEKDYDSVDVDVHGGLTYSGTCDNDRQAICHDPEQGEDDNVWWLGFDCAHLYDYKPLFDFQLRSFTSTRVGTDEVYRDFEYVSTQVTGLARQLKAMEDAA